MLLPTDKKFGAIDPEFCLDQAHWIIKNIPVCQETEFAKVWRFHKESEVPLIREARQHIEKVAKGFEDVYKRYPHTEFFVFTETVKDKPDPVWYKDKVSNGQMHFSIAGGSNINIDNGEKIKNIKVPDGTVWMLNSSQYMHQPVDVNGATRLELFAPLNQLPSFIREKTKQIVDNKWKYLKPIPKEL